MLCPSCLQNTSGTKCQNKDCGQEIPPLYLQRYGEFSRKPSILSVVGFTGHGKTVYLATLMHALEQDLVAVWPRFYRLGLDQKTVDTVMQNSMLLARGELPKPTPRTFPQPSVHLLKEIPRYGTRGLIIYDPSGEAFNSDEGIKSLAGFVQRARAVIFLVSLADLQEPKSNDLYRLLNVYVLGMAKMQARTKNQHLIIAYTKADLLTPEFENHPDVLQHLNSDYTALANPKRYFQTLSDVSSQLWAFTMNHLQAATFVRLAQDQFKSVAFCVVSALGAAPEKDSAGVSRLVTEIKPRCVLDPLLWVLERS